MATCYELHLKNVLNQEEKREFASIARKEAAKYKLAEPDALSYMNAAGQQLDALMTEEFKITSGFNLKSPEGTPAQEKTRVADHVKQGIPTFLNTGVDLFKFIVNSEVKEISARFAKFVNKKELSTNEQAAVKNFKAFIGEYVDKPINLFKFVNDTHIEGVKSAERAAALLNADLFRQLTYKTKNGKRMITEAVKAALGYAAYKALADLETSTHFKDADEMKKIHGKHPVGSFNDAQRLLKNKHLRAGVAINNWGEYAFNALGLSAVKGGSPNMVANLKTALGAQVVQILRYRNVLRVEEIDSLVYHNLFNDSPPKQGEKLPKSRFFYTLEREAQPLVAKSPKQIKELIEGYLAANKGSGGIIDKVFTGTTTTKEILYKASTDIDTVTTTGMAVPKKMQEAQAKVQSTPLEFEASQADLMYGMSRVPMKEGISFAQALVGIKTQTQISKYHKTQRAGIEATNESLQKGLDILNEYIDASYDETTVLPVFLKMDVWKMLRAGTTSSAIDPTGQKIHRYSLIGQDWINKVRFDDQPMVEAFLLRVAEGLDIATDKKSNQTNLEGEITYPVNKHISVRKAVQEYMKQYQGDWYFKADRYREVKDIAYVSFYMTYEFENMDAANFFNKLVEHLKNIGCRSRLNADIPFWS